MKKSLTDRFNFQRSIFYFDKRILPSQTILVLLDAFLEFRFLIKLTPYIIEEHHQIRAIVKLTIIIYYMMILGMILI